MSMLTPPGMGGKYRVTGTAYPRMRRPRRRRRIVLVLVTSLAVAGLAGWGTLQLVDVYSGTSDGAKAKAGAKAGCAPSASPAAVKAVALPAPGTVTVNVLNATPRSGLAKKTADELKKRGFKVGEVGNAPKAYDKKVKDAALLLGAPATSDGAFKVLGAQLAGERTEHDTRSGRTVDLVIGDKFTQLTPRKQATTTLTALKNPEPARAKGC
ncbi:LytR C-terminal domain-containing protein [Streptomyces sp. NPDC060194]|uniref:LytR C-terminal domain-containing protein n=1 Tax=Streptomyces sp. NPDC060194 TaxID=3347069 RepID=UPI003660C122